MPVVLLPLYEGLAALGTTPAAAAAPAAGKPQPLVDDMHAFRFIDSL